MNGLFVTGTDTNVGKTWVGTHLISELINQKIHIAIRKPVESGWDVNNEKNTDAYLLAKAANQLDDLNTICPNRFSRPISPVRAAWHEGEQLNLATLKDQCTNTFRKNSFLYIEGAGGFYSPLCSDGLNADLASALGLPILLVAENRLGCINQVLLNVEAIKRRGLGIKAIVLNNSSNNKMFEMDNADDLSKLLTDPIIEIPFGDKNINTFRKLAQLIV